MSNFAPAVEAATEVIEFLAKADAEVGISEISRGVDLNKNMVFRILNSLEAQGWVYCTDQKYGLTLLPFQITSRVLSRMTLNNVAAPYVYDLWKKTGETTYLGVLKGDKVMYIQHLDGIKDVRVAGRVGGEYDVYCSAPGKILLAHSGEENIERYLKKTLTKRTANTIVESDALRDELCRIRECGYAVDREEFGNGIACAAAPIYDYTGKVTGAIGCSAFVADGDHERVTCRLLPYVTETAREVSICLGAKI